jgi:ubiquitin carboxyl-terminal hydrolase 10
MFMREFRVIASAPSSTKLREAIGGKEKQYGEPFTPGFLYDEMKKSKWLANLEVWSSDACRFLSSLALTLQQQGHQQDAEEFLGLLLQALDDECLRAIGAPVAMIPSAAGSSIAAPAQSKEAGEANDVWLEVGPRQRATITRTSGQNSTSPIAKIFGGLLRSELMVPGRQASVTTEPYQPLQLDIGSPHIRNILDALRGLTSREKLNGDFNSPRGGNVIATKQIHIDELPPVLILHLKRFQFDAEGGTVKVWKKVGYPLELEVPREVLSRQKLNRILAEGAGMPKYRLAAVVYHHGKNASVGHYTVDVRRQDGREWIRIDDTKIDQITSDDVAAAGAEEDPTAEIRKDGNAQGAPANRFGGMDHEDAGDEDGWKQVTASANGNKRWSSVVNGSGRATSAKGKQGQEVINDRKVAYLLFYQRM